MLWIRTFLIIVFRPYKHSVVHFTCLIITVGTHCRRVGLSFNPHRNSCIRLSTRKLSQDDAADFCERYDWHLAIFDNADSREMLTLMLRYSTGNSNNF